MYRVTERENYGFRNSGALAIKTWGNHETLMIAPLLSGTGSFSNALMLAAFFYSAKIPEPLSWLHSYVLQEKL
jgi:hypothetical protein